MTAQIRCSTPRTRKLPNTWAITSAQSWAANLSAIPVTARVKETDDHQKVKKAREQPEPLNVLCL